MNLNTLKSHITRYLVQYHDLITSLFIVFIPPPPPIPIRFFYQAFQLNYFFFSFPLFHIIDRWLIYRHLFLFFASMVLFFPLPSLIIDTSHPCLLRHRSLLVIVTHPHLARVSSRFTTFPFDNTSRIAPFFVFNLFHIELKLAWFRFVPGSWSDYTRRISFQGFAHVDSIVPHHRFPLKKFPLKCNKSGNLSSHDIESQNEFFARGEFPFKRRRREIRISRIVFRSDPILAINALCKRLIWNARLRE